MKNVITKSWMGRICKMAFAAALLSFLSLSFISCCGGGDGGDSGSSGSSGRSFDAKDLSGSENPTIDGTYNFTDSDGGYFVFTPNSSNSDLSFDQGGSSSGTWIYYLAGAMMLRGTYSGVYLAAAAFTWACVVTDIRTGSSWATAVKSTFDFIVNAERRFQAHINKITEQTSGSSGSSGGDGSGTGSGEATFKADKDGKIIYFCDGKCVKKFADGTPEVEGTYTGDPTATSGSLIISVTKFLNPMDEAFRELLGIELPLTGSGKISGDKLTTTYTFFSDEQTETYTRVK